MGAALYSNEFRARPCCRPDACENACAEADSALLIGLKKAGNPHSDAADFSDSDSSTAGLPSEVKMDFDAHPLLLARRCLRSLKNINTRRPRITSAPV